MTGILANRERLNWLLIEGLAIIVSILLAFSIDAWWDGRRDRNEEQELLVGLEIELVDLRGRLDQWANANRSGMQSIGQYLSDSVSEMDLQSIESTFWFASTGNVLDQGGALDALFTSGRLERISDRKVRARLMKWPDWLEDIHTNDLSARGFAVNQIQPFLAKSGIPRTNCTGGRLYCSASGPVPPIYLQLAADSEFRALLMLRRSWMRVAARDHENARLEADEVLTMIRIRLAEFGS
jgi:hypothetical protein